MTVTKKVYILFLVILCQGCSIWDFEYPDDCLWYQLDAGSSEELDTVTDGTTGTDATTDGNQQGVERTGNECSEGPCCDQEGRFYPETHLCDTRTEYRCMQLESGATTEQSLTSQFCTGTSSACEGEVISSPWTTLQKCGSRHICESDGSFAECVFCPYGESEGRCEPLRIVTGYSHTCALLKSGEVKCWGLSANGRLGYGLGPDTQDIGDDEDLSSLEAVDVGGPVTQIALGYSHTCALLDTGEVVCWGDGEHGKLGYANKFTIGDDETPASVGAVDVGGIVKQIAAGGAHTCVLLETDEVKCWGTSASGRLGYGDSNSIGDYETPASVGVVDVGGPVKQIVAGEQHTCALLRSGDMKCWGKSNHGQLGYPGKTVVHVPSSVGPVEVGGPIKQISATGFHTCALLESGDVKCWGQGKYGQLGLGKKTNIGDDETPASVEAIALKGSVKQLSAGGYHNCVVFDAGDIQCWGDAVHGQLGYGNKNAYGDDESLSNIGHIFLGQKVLQISANYYHTCALVEYGTVRCWGQGAHGALGYGNEENIGDDVGEIPPEDVIFVGM